MTLTSQQKLSLLSLRSRLMRTEDVESNFRDIEQSISVIVDSLVTTEEELGEVSLDVGRYTETFTATSAFTVTHSLGSNYPQVSVFNSAGVRTATLVTNVDANSVVLNFTGTLTNAVVVVDVAQT